MTIPRLRDRTTLTWPVILWQLAAVVSLGLVAMAAGWWLTRTDFTPGVRVDRRATVGYEAPWIHPGQQETGVL